MTDHDHHRVTEDWMGKQIENPRGPPTTRPPGVSGWNQPRPSQRPSWALLPGQPWAEVLRSTPSSPGVPAGRGGWQDDEAFAAGVGFTDIVKRPTERAPGIGRKEFEHGKTLLLQKIDHFKPTVVIFTFKQTATKIFGGFAGNGFVPGLFLPGSEVFVMPGPCEKSDSVQKTLADLARHLA